MFRGCAEELKRDTDMSVNDILMGRRFGVYRITDLLGRGGMSSVYRAWDEGLQRDVALKVLELESIGDPRETERFWREARLAARLDHVNVVSVFGTGQEDGFIYLAMELVEGQSLRSLIRDRQGGLPIDQALELGCQTLAALQEAHDQGVIHRDIKPANILLKEDGTVKVVDFGVAKLQGGTALTRVDEILGTVEYMAPEQILGDGIGPATDLYAAGVVLYEMLTGRKPFSGDSPAALVYHQLNEEPRPPSFLKPEVPRLLDRFVLRLLDKLPEGRFGSAKEALMELEKIQRRQQIAQVPGLEESPGEEELELRAGDFQPRFTGRQAELGTLTTHFDNLGSRGRVIFTSGEAGIGKTRVVEQLARYAQESGGRVIRGGCFFEHDMGPYMPFLDAIGGLIGEGRNCLTAEERETLCSTLREQAPELAELAKDQSTTAKFRAGFAAAFGAEENPKAARQRLCDAIFDLLAGAAATRPLVMVLEDMHWADEGSLQLLQYLVSRIPEAQLLCLVTYRPEEVAEADEENLLAALLQRLHSEGLLHEVRLERLERADLMRLATSIFLEADFTDDFGDFLYEQSQGNPFVAVEVLKLLRNQGVLYCEGGVWSVRADLTELEVPERVSALIMRRVGQLDMGHRELLQIAAVVGPWFTSETLETMADISRIELLKALFRLEKQHQLIVSQEGGYEFSHSKIREVLYAEISWELRREYHRMVAEVLEEQQKQGQEIEPEELGTHLFRGEEFARAVPYLLSSGDDAFRLFNWRRAAVLYDQVADACRQGELPPDSSIHALWYSGKAFNLLGVYDRALERLEQMQTVSCAAERSLDEVEAWKMIGKVHELQRDFPQAVEALEKAMACLEGQDAPLSRGGVLINWGCVDFDCGRYGQAEARWQEALRLVEDRYPRPTYEVLHNLAVLAGIRGELDQAWSLYEQTLNLYGQEVTVTKTAFTYMNMGMIRAKQERWEEALELYVRALEICRASRYRFLEPMVEVNRTEALLGKGNLVEAREACSRALRGFRQLNNPLGVADALRLYGRLCRLERNWEDARTYLQQSIDMSRRFGESVTLAEALHELGTVERDTDDVEAALEALFESERIFAQAEAKLDLEKVRADIAELTEMTELKVA